LSLFPFVCVSPEPFFSCSFGLLLREALCGGVAIPLENSFFRLFSVPLLAPPLLRSPLPSPKREVGTWDVERASLARANFVAPQSQPALNAVLGPEAFYNELVSTRLDAALDFDRWRGGRFVGLLVAAGLV
jgi:hypothetical protein